MSVLTALTGLFAGLLARDGALTPPASDPHPKPPPPPQFDARALYDALVSANAIGGDGKVNPFKLYSTREASAADMERMFRPAKPPKGVVPDGILAMDSLNNPMDLWGYSGGSITEGMFWLGFPYLAELAQRTEYRRIAETIAKDMTRRWFRLQATGRDDKTDKIKALEELMKFHKLQEKFTLLALLDGFFGRGHLYIDTGQTDIPDLLKLPLPPDPRIIGKGDLKGLRVVEPMWAYPHVFNANDPLKENFYLPQTWWIMGKEIHRTRVLPFVGREMPDMLKPAYSFAGLSLSQMAKPYVDNWLRTRQSVSDLIHSFSTPVMMTNMGPILNAGASASLKMRAALFNYLRDSNNLMVLDKTTEDFKNVAAPLGGLDHLQAQSQEHMASAVGIPLVVLLGISPSGLNATSEGELQVWAQFIHAAQGSFFDAHLTTILNVMQLSLFGEIDPAITHAWEPLRELSEEEESTAEKTQADIDAAYVNMGVLSPDEIRQRLSGEADSPYQGLDLDTPAPPPPQQEQDPLGGGGHDPLGGVGGGGPGGPPGGGGGPPGAGGPGGAANLNSKPAGGSPGPIHGGAVHPGSAGGSAAPPSPKAGSRDEAGPEGDDQPISVLDPNTGHTRILPQDPNAEIHVHLGPNDHAHVKLGADRSIGVAFGMDAIDAFNPNQKRGQPENAGEFGPGGGGHGKGAVAGIRGKTTTKTYVHAREDETPASAPGRQEPHLGGTPAHEGQRVSHSVIHLHAGERMSQLSQPQGSAIVGAGKNYVMGYGQHNYDLIASKIGELDPEKRGSMAARALQVAKAWPQMVKHTITKEKDEIVHTLGGIKALLTPGKSPTPEQWHSMRHMATTAIVLAGTVYMGLPAHAGAAEVAGHLGDELLKHVITEHALEVMVGAGLSALSMIAPGHAPEHKTPTLKQTQGYDAALPDDPESPENIKLMQQWFTALAESIKTITPEKAQELMQKNGTRGDTFDEDDDGADPTADRYDGGAQDDFDPNEPRDESGRWGSPGGHIQWNLPPAPGTAPIPEGHIRLYHQTDEKNLGAIKHQGILGNKARGIEGPRGIYADPKGFYGAPATQPTVEFHVPKAQWDGPFVQADSVSPAQIIAVHHPWHDIARTLEASPNAIKAIVAGQRDRLINDPTYGRAIRFIKHKYGGQAHDAFDPSEKRDESGKWSEGGGGGGETPEAANARRVKGFLDRSHKEFEEKNKDLAEVGQRVEAGLHPKKKPKSWPQRAKEIDRTISLLRKPIHLFHGTASTAMASILKNGIVPHGSEGGDVWLQKNDPDVFHYDAKTFGQHGRSHSVFASLSKDVAVNFARLATEIHPGSTPIVFVVDIPAKELPGHLRPDELAGVGLSAFRFEGTIKPEWITDTLTIGANDEAPGQRIYVGIVASGSDDDDDDLAQDEFIESEHPRGQPDNAGQFVKGAGGAKSAAKVPAAPRAVAVPVPTPASKNTSRVIRSAAFVSSNVAEHLDFGAASSGLASARHKLLRTLSEEVDDALEMHSTSRGIIGAWSDGAEDSVITEADNVDWETLKASVAMKASLANQKAALIFQDGEEGSQGPEGSEPAHLMSFEATGSLEEIHQNLLADGVDFHSIVPHEGGATVYNVDLDGSRQASMEKAAERYGTTPSIQYGHAQFIGNTDNSGDGDQAQRHEAQLAYARLLKGSGVDGVAAIWKRIRPTYGQAFEVSEYPKEETTTPLPGNHGHPALISSRRPTAVGAVEGDEYRRIDMTAMKQDERVYTENMNLMKNDLAYPNFRPEEVEGKTPAEIERAAINLAKANLRFLYDHAPASVREHGPDWYEGAHNFAVAKAKEYGIPLQSAVAVYAALSPQNLWEANVKQGDAVLDIYFHHQDTAWSPEMTATAARIWKPRHARFLARIQGKTLAELQLPAEKAMWIRTYDEAHNPRGFNRLTPDGKVIGPYYNLDGMPATASWKTTGAIANAIASLESGGNRDIISMSMGDLHKVRSFYNNILDPDNDNEDVTMDTHAIGAVLLRPETGNSTTVAQSLKTAPEKSKREPGFEGASGSNVLGVKGTYALWADAYRELAHELHIKPRVLQSVTWVAKRKLFDSRTTDETRDAVQRTWREYHDGTRSLEDTQNEVLRLAGGMDKPEDGTPQPPRPRPPKAKKA